MPAKTAKQRKFMTAVAKNPKFAKKVGVSQSVGKEFTAKKGGAVKKKTKSKVNQAGNYTKPGMRKALFESIKAGGKGGAPGQWSARKAQMLAKQYKAKGGGYKS